MTVALVVVLRSLDGFETCFTRPVEMPGAPQVGTTVAVGGVFVRLTHVHFDADQGIYLAVVDAEMVVPAPHPRNRTELLEVMGPRLPGWTVAPAPPHLHLVK